LVPKSVKRKKKIEKKEKEIKKLIAESEKIQKELDDIAIRKEKKFETIKSIKKILTLVIDIG
jgi:formiminotetrahydrofolate cyclodeaminase